MGIGCTWWERGDELAGEAMTGEVLCISLCAFDPISAQPISLDQCIPMHPFMRSQLQHMPSYAHCVYTLFNV